MAASTAIVDTRSASGALPSVTYRQAGDRYLMIEYGDMVLDLTLNFFVLAVQKEIHERGIRGVVETSPGLRSMLVGFDGTQTTQAELIAAMDELHSTTPPIDSLVLPSRVIHMPIAFDDSQSTKAVAQYVRQVREDAPNARGDNNIDYVVSYNGYTDREALYAEILATDWWNAFTGFFPGLPFMFPLDSRYEPFAPKYNPTRLWTAEGAVGIGGPCVAIYPVESPGGYQLFGRTIPIYDILERNRVFRGDPILIKPGDRVRFHRVSEDELLAAFDAVRSDSYTYEIEDGELSVAAHVEGAKDHEAEASEKRAARQAAAAACPVP